MENGGIVIIVRADAEAAERAEEIIRRHDAHQVDEQIIGDPGAEADGDTSIPVVEEELMVGKRAVHSGGVRVVSRVTETPVTEGVSLREEHAHIERKPVDRSASEDDFLRATQVIEVEETGEEAVVAKTARVVEEVFLDRETIERTEVVSDTVRHTEVEVEPITAGESLTNADKTVRPSVRNDKEIN